MRIRTFSHEMYVSHDCDFLFILLSTKEDILFNRSSLYRTARLDYIPLLPSLMTSVEQFFD